MQVVVGERESEGIPGVQSEAVQEVVIINDGDESEAAEVQDAHQVHTLTSSLTTWFQPDISLRFGWVCQPTQIQPVFIVRG